MIANNAFPETGRREGFRYAMAKQAMRFLRTEMKHNEDYDEAYYRAKKDVAFVHRIGELVSTLHVLHYPTDSAS